MVQLPTAANDLIALLSLPGLYCLMLLFGRWLKRSHGVRLNWSYHLFSFCIAIYFLADLFDWKLTYTWHGQEYEYHRELFALVCILGAIFIISLIDRYIWDLYFRQKHRVKIPKFVSEVVTLCIILISLVVIIRFGYNKHIEGLVIAPSVLAVVAGLAMQNLLGNIIAGLALQFGKNFKDGDWLFVDNKYAQVIDINWRSTRLRTVDDVSVDIPNLDMSKSVIVNLNLPHRLHAMRLSVSVDYAAPPTRVKDVLLHATSNAKGVSPEHRPSVFLKNFADYAVEYEVKFWMDNHDHYDDTCDAIRTNIWYSFQRHGIRIPFPIRTVQVERPARKKEEEIQTTARIILRQHPLFKTLTDEQLDGLLPRGKLVHFGRGEKLIEQGDEGESMFILVSGEANVVVQTNNTPVHVASLRSGDCFGEMSLLTGERRSATILAHTDCEVVEIGKPVLARNLKENPELLEKLGDLLATRQMHTEGIVAANTPEEVTATQIIYTNTFMDKLKVFFEL
ncbi:MAG TPA: mechanosensitive ion channel family protein [Verrucomicrobiae bacterium]|jgi:small-conductance mechanosensitive channel|nr:mechanosensitive ion channel family protein [Verrucomicrobiae bacterium]